MLRNAWSSRCPAAARISLAGSCRHPNSDPLPVFYDTLAMEQEGLVGSNARVPGLIWIVFVYDHASECFRSCFFECTRACM
jgi:hypothetical protein